MARIAKSAGCEYIILDMEHSGWGFETVKDQIQFARGAGIVPLVNPPGDDFNLITRSLDLGAKGILVPVVETKAQAEAIVRATRYPPHGRRGSAFGVAHDDYIIGDARKTMKAANDSVLVMIKIETKKGVQNVDEIMAVPGVDAFLIGPNDLAYSLIGKRGARTPEVLAVVDDVCRRLAAAGKRFGMPANWDQLDAFRASGATLLYFPIEWLLDRALRELSARLGLR